MIGRCLELPEIRPVPDWCHSSLSETIFLLCEAEKKNSPLLKTFPSSEQQHPQSYLVHIIIRKAGNAIMRKCIWPRIFSIFDCCSCLSLNPTKCWIKSLSTQVIYQPLETEVNLSISKGGRAIIGKCIQQSVNPIFQHMVPVCTFVM